MPEVMVEQIRGKLSTENESRNILTKYGSLTKQQTTEHMKEQYLHSIHA